MSNDMVVDLLVRARAEGQAQIGSLRESVSGLGTALASLAALVGTGALLKSAISEGVAFNSVMEQSRLGIASLITAGARISGDVAAEYAEVAKVSDERMAALSASGIGSMDAARDGASQLALAMKASDEQVQKLRIAGLETAASTTELVAAFQQAIAPGLVAGLKMDEVRQFTVLVTQAAGAMGVPMNALGQELKSVLSGTIDINSQIANSLGITNEMVGKWREQGVLAQKLNEKMAGFAVAGQEVSRTWSGVTSNLQDTLSILAGSATEGLFNGLKTSMQKAMGGVFDSATASIAPEVQRVADAMNAVATAAGKGLGAALEGAVAAVKEFGGWLETNKDRTAEISKLVGQVSSEVGGLVREAWSVDDGMAGWLVSSGAVADSLQVVRLIVAGIRDGFVVVTGVVAGIEAAVFKAGGVALRLVNLLGRVSGVIDKDNLLLRDMASGMDTMSEATKERALESVQAIAAEKTAVAGLVAEWQNGGNTARETARVQAAASREAADQAKKLTEITAKESAAQLKIKDDLVKQATDLLVTEGQKKLTAIAVLEQQQLAQARGNEALILDVKKQAVKSAIGEIQKEKLEGLTAAREVAQVKINTQKALLDDLKDKLKESLTEERQYVNQLKGLEAELSGAVTTEEQRKRENKRKTMTEDGKQRDILSEIADLQREETEKLRKDDIEAARIAHKRVGELIGQITSEERRDRLQEEHHRNFVAINTAQQALVRERIATQKTQSDALKSQIDDQEKRLKDLTAEMTKLNEAIAAPKTIDVSVQEARRRIEEIRRLLDDIKDKTVTVTVNQVGSGQVISLGASSDGASQVRTALGLSGPSSAADPFQGGASSDGASQLRTALGLSGPSSAAGQVISSDGASQVRAALGLSGPSSAADPFQGVAASSPFDWSGSGATTAVNWGASSVVDWSGWPGFASGGDFMVGGPAGIDRTMVQFLATPGERVTIQTPEQQRSAGSGQPSVVQNFTINVQNGGADLADRIVRSIQQRLRTEPNLLTPGFARAG